MRGRLVSRAAALAPVVVLVLGGVPACGQNALAPPDADGGALDGSYAFEPDARVVRVKDAGQPHVDADMHLDRLSPHRRNVLATMRLQAVYIGFAGDDGAPDFDEFQTWLLASKEYWTLLLPQYGVSAGSLIGSVRISASAALPSSIVKKGLVSAEDLNARIFEILHPTPVVSPDAGPDAADSAGGSDGARPDALPTIPAADAYIFFLPNGVNVSLGERAGHTFKTCEDAGGYHSFDGAEPYAVIPPCSLGRNPMTISHELAEMATDPFPGQGWFSDADVDNAGGEIGDLCNQQVPHGIEGWAVTQLWSNHDGGCVPE